MSTHFQEALADSTSSSDICSSLDHISTQCPSHKLEEQPIFKSDISSIVGSCGRTSPYSPSHLRSEQLRNRLLQNFQAAFLLANDGNSFYRLVGIEHIKYMTRNTAALDEFRKVLRKKHFDLGLLQNVPQDFSLFDNREILSIIEGLVQALTHCTSAEFCQRMVTMMSHQPSIDFAVVAAYRLYAYHMGYRHIQSELSMLLQGNQEPAILSYGHEVAPIVIKIIAESLSASLSIYTMLDDEIELTSFGLEWSEHHKFEVSVILRNNRYTLLVHKDAKPGKEAKEFRGRQEDVVGGKGQGETEVGMLDDDFFEDIYQSMSEQDKRDIVLDYIRTNYSIQHY